MKVLFFLKKKYPTGSPSSHDNKERYRWGGNEVLQSDTMQVRRE